MPNRSYLDSLNQYLSQNYPQPTALWNDSNNNVLGQDWLYATPTAVWGKTYAEFKQAVPGNSPGFNFQPCTVADGPTQQCVAVDATITAPNGTAQQLLAGHSYQIADALYDVMTSAEICLDFTTLTPPTGSFLQAFKNAITYISNKPENQRPVIRILFSNPLPNIPKLEAVPFLESITEQLDPSAKMEIYVTVMSSSFSSWNHAKIVAADGTRALVGGHNMWDAHYLGINPVFDVSMRLSGSAALHAQDYANNLWDYARWRSHNLGTWIIDNEAQELNLHTAYLYNKSTGRSEIVTPTYPAAMLYSSLKARFPAPATAPSTRIISIGRGGDIRLSYLLPTLYSYVFPFTEPGDAAIVQLVSQATSSIRMSLQSFRLAFGVIAGWNNALFLEIGRALKRGVQAKIVVSNVGAVAGGLTNLSAPYDGDSLATINEKMLLTLTAGLGMEEINAKALIRDQFQVASFRYSSDLTYPNNVPIPNHSKTLIIDETVFYIGSQNLYASNLSEFGYVVEDAQIAQDYMTRYWTPLWQYSSSTVVSTYDEVLKEEEQFEAVEFILNLDQNTKSNLIWSDLLAKYNSETDPTKLDTTKQRMNDLIVNGGFVTTLSKVLAGLQQPFFTETPPSTEPTTEALRFVANVMNSPDLMKSFSDVIGQPTDSVDQANQNVTNFLTKNGYDCTALQILAAFAAMRRKVLSYWAGNYTTWTTADGGLSYTLNANYPAANATALGTLKAVLTDADPIPPILGPVLVISPEGEVTFGGAKIQNPSYNNNTLSWAVAAGNQSAATLSFGTITRAAINDDFQGNECFGTVTYTDSSSGGTPSIHSFYGRINLPKDNPDNTDQHNYTVYYVLGALALAGLFSTLGYFFLKNRARQIQYELVAQRKRRSDGEDFGAEYELTPVSSPNRATELNTLKLSMARDKLKLQEQTLEELAQYENAMTWEQKVSLQEAGTQLETVSKELQDPLFDLETVSAQLQSLKEIDATLGDLASALESALSDQAQTLLKNNAEESAKINERIDAYDQDQEDGQSFEFEEEI